MTESPKPLGMSDFFALEAGEYLERLDGMLAQGDSPSADEIVRLARALRGSALMANQPAIARAAAGLEVLARAVREGRRVWDPQTQQLALRAVDDLKIFVRRAGSWTDADTAKAEALAVELEQVAGRPSAQIRAVEALGLDAGARAFVAREGAAIAGALERAAQALRANPRAHDPLPHVMRALQPLRGLAALTDLPPLPDLLEGIERAIGELSRSALEPPHRVARRSRGAPVHAGQAGAREPRRASASGGGLARARPLRHAARAARSHARHHLSCARERGRGRARRPRGPVRDRGARGGGVGDCREQRGRLRRRAAACRRPAGALWDGRRGSAGNRARRPHRGAARDPARRRSRPRPPSSARRSGSRSASHARVAADTTSRRGAGGSGGEIGARATG